MAPNNTKDKYIQLSISSTEQPKTYMNELNKVCTSCLLFYLSKKFQSTFQTILDVD